MKIYRQNDTKNRQPEESGCYNTDKGVLYWSPLNFGWSCSEDIFNEVYPKFWYEEVSLVELKKTLNKTK